MLPLLAFHEVKMISLRLREPNASRSILQAWSVSGGLQGEQPLRQPQCTHGLKQSMFNIVCMNDDVILVLAASRLAHTERIHHRTDGSWAIRGGISRNRDLRLFLRLLGPPQQPPAATRLDGTHETSQPAHTGSSFVSPSAISGSCCFSIRVVAAAGEWWEDDMHGGW